MFWNKYKEENLNLKNRISELEKEKAMILKRNAQDEQKYVQKLNQFALENQEKDQEIITLTFHIEKSSKQQQDIINEFKNTSIKTKQKIEDLNSQIEEKEQNIKKINMDNKDLSELYNATTRENKKQISKLQGMIDQQNQNLYSLEQIVVKSKSKYELLESEIQKIFAQIYKQIDSDENLCFEKTPLIEEILKDNNISVELVYYTISNLVKTLKKLKQENSDLKSLNLELENTNNALFNYFEKSDQSTILLQTGKIINLIDEMNLLHADISTLQETINEKQEEIFILDSDIQTKKNNLNDIENDITHQFVHPYIKLYNCLNTISYKEKLDKIIDDEKNIEKNYMSISYINYKNNTYIKAIKRFVLRSFNLECSMLINKISLRNWESTINKIKSSFERSNNFLNKTQVNNILVPEEYLEYKIKEAKLCFEYEEQKKLEKEEAKILLDEKRQEEKVRKEISEKKEKLLKELTHYTNQIGELVKKIEEYQINHKPIDDITLQKYHEYQEETERIKASIDGLQNLEANIRAGYVYVISNVGSFGKDVYKIGMTRRPDPMDRVRELASASVPFPFDVHAIIFSKDAPTLETNLHHELDEYKINKSTNRKEFYKVPFNILKSALLKYCGEGIDIIEESEAAEYYESLKIKSKPIGE